MKPKEFAEQIRAVVFGHAVADALGVPVEFMSRDALDLSPVTEMMGYGTYPYPAGCWSDDTSMALCALDSLCTGSVDFDDIMQKFGEWYYKDAYTPTGKLFDVGNTCAMAIERYCTMQKKPLECGLTSSYSNGNGSLMRMYPFVLFAYQKQLPQEELLELIHNASALTHAHPISKIGCGIYALVLMELLANPCKDAVSSALAKAVQVYQGQSEFCHYERLCSPDFESISRDDIKSSGYVVDSLEAAIWCLQNTDSYRDCVLKAVNLGSDTDTVAAIAGSLAGALYGPEAIPSEWLDELKRKDYIEEMCRRALDAWC